MNRINIYRSLVGREQLRFDFIVLLFCLPNFLFAQLDREQCIGSWQIQVDSSRQSSMDMLFDGVVIRITADSFETSIMNEDDKGTWEIEDESIVLSTSKVPPIVLSDFLEDQCQFHLDMGMPSTITMRRLDQEVKNEVSAIIPLTGIKAEDLFGRWVNTCIEDVKFSQSRNAFLFGGSTLDHFLEIYSEGSFLMHREFPNESGLTYLKGDWQLIEDLLILVDQKGNSDTLFFTKMQNDSMTLVDSRPHPLPVMGKAQLRYIFTRTLASGIRKYLLKADSLVDFSEQGIPFSFAVPSGTEVSDFLTKYGVDLYPLLFMSVYDHPKSSDYPTIAERFEEIKELNYDKEGFKRVLFEEDYFVILEHEIEITGRLMYDLIHVFEDSNGIYRVTVSSPFQVNLVTMITSLRNKEPAD